MASCSAFQIPTPTFNFVSGYPFMSSLVVIVDDLITLFLK